MKINDITNRIDASYNTIKKFVEKSPEYYKKINNIIHVSNEGLEALEGKYGVRSEVMSDTNVDFYKAQVRFMGNQLEEIREYNQVFKKLIETKDHESEARAKEFEQQSNMIKELENRIHQHELEKQEIKHELDLERNKSFFQKIFNKKR